MSKRTLVIYATFLVGCLIGCALGVRAVAHTDPNGAITTDIASIRASPNKYAGKFVQLSGKLDQCFGWECSVCPETMSGQTADPNQCLALSFRPLIPKTGFGEEEQEALFRYSSVRLVARFDPSCWRGPCLDRQTVLEDANVISVEKRRSSRDGLWRGSSTPLQEAPAQLSSLIRSEALEAGFPSNPVVKVFTIDGGNGQEAVVCWTTFGMNSWPASLEGAIDAPSTLDFYHCNRVKKTAPDRWIVQVQ